MSAKGGQLLSRALVGWWGVKALLLWVAANIAIAGENRCIPRETRNTFQGAVVHGPVAEAHCTECHGPHVTERPRLLRDDIPGLCIGCHDQPMEDAAGRTIPSMKALIESSEAVVGDGGLKLHRPFADGDCLCCHDPHASSNYRLLSRKHVESLYASYSEENYMCFGCHDKQAFAEPRTLSATNFRNGNLNLHYRHVNRSKGRSCQLCHEHHASKYSALIREQTPFGQRSIAITVFEKTENGGKCAPSCHILVNYDRLEPALNALKVSPREGEDATAEELWQALNPSASGGDRPEAPAQ